MTAVFLFLFWLVAAFVLFTTLAPLTDSVQWWIRGWDFPRIHIAIVAAVTILIGFGVMRPSVAITCVLLLGCLVYQLYRIYPYTSLATQEIALAENVPAEDQVKLLSSNVLMENDDPTRLQALIEREEPDVLFLMETDQKWIDWLEPQLARYDTVIRHPLDNYYGAVFATNLETVTAQTVFLSEDETPSVLAELKAPTGSFYFVGLHPRPPVPGQNTDERDAQIRRAAIMADRSILPVVAMGDFNDVAWSRTSEKFKEYGEFLDPRIGRGMLPSFDAQSWWMRFPIDQLYVTQGLDLITYDRLEDVGSDHFPMIAVISVKAD
ncbi:endonuclease/exonuclease/phosphatase family protein [Yoonia sp. 208BN28-4]|uniref:endonuclease/exonuclease/phosphatase family protein n=1 Tax=Yoonia sp. 208BN28-4 TaxID=3126505 RepID=UPI0030949396